MLLGQYSTTCLSRSSASSPFGQEAGGIPFLDMKELPRGCKAPMRLIHSGAVSHSVVKYIVKPLCLALSEVFQQSLFYFGVNR